MNKQTARWIKVMSISKKIFYCHQIAERSFFLMGYQFPICARCTGIFVGYIFSFVLLILDVLINPIVCLLMLIPLVIDGGVQLLFTIMSNNVRRFITGLLYGVGFIQIFANIILLLF